MTEEKKRKLYATTEYVIAEKQFQNASARFRAACQAMRDTLSRGDNFVCYAGIENGLYLVSVDDDSTDFEVTKVEVIQ